MTKMACSFVPSLGQGNGPRCRGPIQYMFSVQLPSVPLLFIIYQAVLHFMTGYTSNEEGAAVSQDVVKVLVLSGLMKWFVLK